MESWGIALTQGRMGDTSQVQTSISSACDSLLWLDSWVRLVFRVHLLEWLAMFSKIPVQVKDSFKQLLSKLRWKL